MFNNEEYLSNADSISFEEAIEIYNCLLKAIDLNDKESLELYSEVVKAAVKYIEIRNRWQFLSIEEKKEIDNTRTSLHNAYIASIKPLYRYMDNNKNDISWYEKLIQGNENRKRLGDFAGYLLCINSIMAR